MLAIRPFNRAIMLEAIDLACGPDRLNRTLPINEHDFYQGKYLSSLNN